MVSSFSSLRLRKKSKAGANPRLLLIENRFAQEAWMHPSLFACASGNKSAEFDVAAGFDGNLQSAQWTLEKHWDEWITEDDFAYLQNIGSFSFPHRPFLS